MDDMSEKIENTKDKMDDEFHEYKGRAQQKKDDMPDD